MDNQDISCADCYWWQSSSPKPLEEKGFCYKQRTSPEPKTRYDSCGDFQKDDFREPNLER